MKTQYEILMDLIEGMPGGTATPNLSPFMRRLNDPRIPMANKEELYKKLIMKSGRPPEITLEQLIPDQRIPISGPGRASGQWSY